MNLIEAVELMKKYAACRNCGCETIGNGKGTMEVDSEKGYFKRTCRCGWQIEVRETVHESN